MGASSETTPSVLTTTTIHYTLYSNITGEQCQPRTLSSCPHPAWQPPGPGEEGLTRTTPSGAGHGGGISGVRPGPAQRGDSQTSETRVSVTHPCQQHRGGQHRHSIQRHPQLQHLAGGEDRPDADQHSEPHQPLGSSQDPLRPQHSQLREPGEKTDSDGPPESLHSGSPHLTVTPHSTSFLPIFY